MKGNRFSILKRLYSFKYAFNGLRILFKEEHNARIHLVAAICAIVLAGVLNISALEWVAIVLAIGLVISLEAVNSAIENLADYVSPNWNHNIKRVKDISAAGVLIASIVALVTGLLIFIPKIIELC
ncbi:MAG: diacylglycerol kinase family protein [Bacteroidales bacterium]|nr:diacylglycerol kinase family protein [Bacteroidales bacterium]MBN2750267.1 diacylglycerol kinase family protein [Bacteroidales bacterium]